MVKSRFCWAAGRGDLLTIFDVDAFLPMHRHV